MTLEINAAFPSSRCYVLKVHRDAQPEQGRLTGRLEHIASGDYINFDNGTQLLAWIAHHVSALDIPTAAKPKNAPSPR